MIKIQQINVGGFSLDITVNKAKVLKEKPQESHLVFGTQFTDHMFVADYSPDKGWHDPRIIPYGPVTLDPSTMIFHYGQGIFEGMKAYCREDGKIGIFRPRSYLSRMNRSAQRLCIPQIDEEFAYQGLMELLKLEQDWVPKSFETSLYLSLIHISFHLHPKLFQVWLIILLYK